MQPFTAKIFPDPESAGPDGLIAHSAKLTPALVLAAYSEGIFPWSENPVRWYSPDPRAIFLRDYLHLPKRLGRVMRKEQLTVTFDTAFRSVIEGCAAAHAEEGVWISRGFIETYTQLYEQGYAHSVEVWQNETLVGGLYGVQLGGLFSGESMFYRVANASKIAFVNLIAMLDIVGTQLIDAQVINPHTERLGAITVSRQTYLRALEKVISLQCRFTTEHWPRTL